MLAVKSILSNTPARAITALALSVLAAPALASEGGGGLPQFKAEWFPSQLFWLAVTFVVLYVFFARLALPRIAGTLENRQRKIQGDLDAAADLSARAKTIRETYERAMARAKDRAGDAMRQADTQFKAKAADMLYAYRTKFTQEIGRAENDLAGLRARLINDMNAVATEITASAASNILHAPADPDQARRIVDELSGNKKAA